MQGRKLFAATAVGVSRPRRSPVSRGRAIRAEWPVGRAGGRAGVGVGGQQVEGAVGRACRLRAGEVGLGKRVERRDGGQQQRRHAGRRLQQGRQPLSQQAKPLGGGLGAGGSPQRGAQRLGKALQVASLLEQDHGAGEALGQTIAWRGRRLGRQRGEQQCSLEVLQRMHGVRGGRGHVHCDGLSSVQSVIDARMNTRAAVPQLRLRNAEVALLAFFLQMQEYTATPLDRVCGRPIGPPDW